MVSTILAPREVSYGIYSNGQRPAQNGNFGEVIGYSNIRRYMPTIADFTPANRWRNTQPLKETISLFTCDFNFFLTN